MKSKCEYKKKKKRVGRGIGSTLGKTCGRGTKGQFSRTGAKARTWSEGGQNSFIRRLPKRGFNSPDKKIFAVVNLGQLNNFSDEVGPQDLMSAGLFKRMPHGVKILGKGSIKKAVKVSAHAVSASARAAIEAAGGSVTIINK